MYVTTICRNRRRFVFRKTNSFRRAYVTTRRAHATQWLWRSRSDFVSREAFPSVFDFSARAFIIYNEPPFFRGRTSVTRRHPFFRGRTDRISSVRRCRFNFLFKNKNNRLCYVRSRFFRLRPDKMELVYDSLVPEVCLEFFRFPTPLFSVIR